MKHSHRLSEPLRRSLIARIRKLSHPLEPQPTSVVPRWNLNADIRAVLFDVYGTLLMASASDLDSVMSPNCADHFRAAMEAVGIPCDDETPNLAQELYFQIIRTSHADAASKGILHPEVEVCSVWRELLARLVNYGKLRNVDPNNKTLVCTLAVEYEFRAKPVWPMRGLRETLTALCQCRLLLGIVSNAQFYTPLALEAFLEEPIERFFENRLCVWSWELGVAKPSPELFRLALNVLKKNWGISPEQTLHVGNDMLNDIWAASQAGCRTALFAGDARSFRPCSNDASLSGVEPDAVIVQLDELLRLPHI